MGTASSPGVAQAFLNVPAGQWDERIARARSLAGNPSPASAILAFYADLASCQRTLAGSSLRDELDVGGPSDLLVVVEPAARALPGLLRWLQGHAPAALAHAAAEGAAIGIEDWKRLLEQRLVEGRIDEEGPAAFVVEAILQPFVQRVRPVVERVRLKADPTYDATYEARCPVCASLPVAAALREEGHGGRRSLVCSLCFAEWDYRRIQCPACKENRFDALPVYSSDVPVNARIDACDTCRTYIKTIDLTRDGLAIPAVDDLATLPLDLWARERGYQRLYPNLLRI
jgi:formate dehydrogenase maturation protein FdhE